jgi:ABC-2 type transport system ATP-binding protein
MDNHYSLLVNHAVKKYPRAALPAVNDISLSVKPGEIYGFLGPNGAGKTTAIKMFTTLLFPNAGKITVNGFDVQSQYQQVRQSIGVVFQTPSLDDKLTVEENLRSHAILYNVAPYALSYAAMSDEYKYRLSEVLELVGLPEHKSTIVKTLSGGMRRRIDIAKALLHVPKVLFLDEPTTGLDPQSRQAIWHYLDALHTKYKFTVFLTTQYLEEAEICNRISIIDHGKIVVTDSPRQLKQSIGQEVLILETDQAGQLEKELDAQHLVYKKAATEPEYIVQLSGQRAQTILNHIKTPLSSLTVRQPSLDDVFMHYTGRSME